MDYGIDANGCLTEDIELAGGSVRIRYDDVPESDIMTVEGIGVTTPLRTVIDLAPELDADELDRMIETCLARQLFSVEEATVRVNQPDIASRRGARLVRAHRRRHRRHLAPRSGA